MDKKILLSRLNAIFIEVFDDDTISLSEEITANDIEKWDSLNHIHLVMFIERDFDVRFTTEEIQSWIRVGDIMDSLLKKDE